jgi:hypothetical protein
MKILTLILFTLSISFAQMGKIDTHGGNYDSLSSGSNFNKPIGFGSLLEKKENKIEKKTLKNIKSSKINTNKNKKIDIDKIESINK